MRDIFCFFCGGDAVYVLVTGDVVVVLRTTWFRRFEGMLKALAN